MMFELLCDLKILPEPPETLELLCLLAHHLSIHQQYNLINLTASIDFPGDEWGMDYMILNINDEAGVNSSMTDVFGVAATGLELIAPRQVMVRIRKNF